MSNLLRNLGGWLSNWYQVTWCQDRESILYCAKSSVCEISVKGRVKEGIDEVGSILGEENVNVSFMSVGRIAPRTHAVMAIGVDEQPRKESLKRIGEVPSIEELVFLEL
ncbi:D-3-phosphoglycerate dehydrogenase 3, chloroplastic-like [Hibiscus syriacus]|uniref:D-3-phosphoglycerate dehydrogenase 3, chloroplastic-like n=1 Tax=Hibiscus syriacus TaxID=106335 RepID=UPI001922E3E4|nr:D-3-phosphoglycerate dehydrogenase 3, chloroplastic-like [Hibiscus syriacus]